MARRRIKTNRLTSVRFISADDGAIGPKADYGKYLRTMNEEHLDLGSEVPAYYYVRAMNAPAHEYVREELAMDDMYEFKAYEPKEAVGDEPDEPEEVVGDEDEGEEDLVMGRMVLKPEYADMEPLERAALSEALGAGREMVLNKIIDYCVVGCEEHPYVESIGPDGAPVIKTVTWVQGTPRPEGLLEMLVVDRQLCIPMRNFITRLSFLSSSEKKR